MIHTIKKYIFCLNFILYSVYCLNELHTTPYAVHCTLFSVLVRCILTLYSLHYTLYIVRFTLYIVHYTLYFVHLTLHTVHFILNTKRLQFKHTLSLLYTECCTMYSVHTKLLYTVQTNPAVPTNIALHRAH